MAHLIATTVFGLESVVGRELGDLGYCDSSVENGRVTFAAGPSGICRANLWLRSAERVLLKMGEFEARTFDELFERTKAIDWADWIPEDGAFPVEGKSVRSTLHSVPDCQAVVKKAVVESLARRYGRKWFEETGPEYRIEVALLKDVATLTIDTSGAGLHKRGYRRQGGGAPLKETLAAGLVLLSRWRPELPFLDPLCGSGTIPIEAAMIGMNMAPGLKRSFASEAWGNIPPRLWREARAEAMDAAHPDLRMEIEGSDADRGMVALSISNAEKAGLGRAVRFVARDVGETRRNDRYGCLVCNPPYGERLGEEREAEALYREMGRVFRSLDTWSFYVLTASPGFERVFGRASDRKRKLYNGRIECHFHQFFGPRPPRPTAVTPSQ